MSEVPLQAYTHELGPPYERWWTLGPSNPCTVNVCGSVDHAGPRVNARDRYSAGFRSLHGYLAYPLSDQWAHTSYGRALGPA
jgi:hypothetical protein